MGSERIMKHIRSILPILDNQFNFLVLIRKFITIIQFIIKKICILNKSIITKFRMGSILNMTQVNCDIPMAGSTTH